MSQIFQIDLPDPPAGYVAVPGRKYQPGDDCRFWSALHGTWVFEKDIQGKPEHRPIAFRLAPKKRLMTPLELLGKWIHAKEQIAFVGSCSGDTIHFANLYGPSACCVTVKAMHQSGYTYSDTPTGPQKPMEVEDDADAAIAKAK